jgi:ribose 5-phosphate isomerase B
MKIYIGSDHNGYDLKQEVLKYLKKLGHTVIDEGDERLDPDDDFTVFAGRVVNAMKADSDHTARGILICGSGQGMIIAANRHKGIRAGLGWSVESAQSIRTDEDSNVLALPAEFLRNKNNWKEIIDAWLSTPFAGASRYKRRIKQLDN